MLQFLRMVFVDMCWQSADKEGGGKKKLESKHGTLSRSVEQLVSS